MSATPKATITEKAPMMSVTGLKSPDEPGIVEPTTTVYRFSDQPTQPVLDDGPGVDPRQVRAAQLMTERGLDVSKYHGLYTNEQLIIRQQCLDEAFGLGRFAPPEVQTDVPSISTDQAREVLRGYITERDEAEHYLRVANDAVTRAMVRVQEASDQVQNFHGLDEDIIQHNVQAIKDGNTADLPAALQHKQAQRSKATDRFTGAQNALDRLQQEARTIEATAVQARQKVSTAAAVVLQTMYEGLVPAIVQLETQAKQLRSELLSFGRAWFAQSGSGPKYGAMSPSVVTFLRAPVLNADAASDSDIVQRLQAYHNSLCNDADFEF